MYFLIWVVCCLLWLFIYLTKFAIIGYWIVDPRHPVFLVDFTKTIYLYFVVAKVLNNAHTRLSKYNVLSEELQSCFQLSDIIRV